MAAKDPFQIISDAAKTADAFRAGVALLSSRLDATVKKHGTALLRQVKANASGRPGPRVQTGDYRRSINLRIESVTVPGAPRGAVRATVGTNSPQGRRLEYGFMNMTDSLGRLFHQPPFPHFGPAFDHIAPLFEAAVAKDVDFVLAAIKDF